MNIKEFLNHHYTDCVYTINTAGDYSSIDWDVNNPRELPKEDYILEWIETNERNYITLRKREYPSIEECIHSILDNDLDSLQIKRKAVKDKYPKPNIGNIKE
jgi:hypothetical protein